MSVDKTGLAAALERLLQLASKGRDPSFRDLALAAGLDPARDFKGMSLRELDFRDEDLSEFDFSGADLSGGDFRRAKTDRANFTNAELTGVIGLSPSAASPLDDGTGMGAEKPTDAKTIKLKREAIIEAASGKFGISLGSLTKAMYLASDQSYRIVCTISKRYPNRKSYQYWYAFHPKWDEFLSRVEHGVLLLGCMDKDVAFAIPHSVIKAALSDLNVTDDNRRIYWHLHLGENSNTANMELIVPRKQENISLSQYQITI